MREEAKTVSANLQTAAQIERFSRIITKAQIEESAKALRGKSPAEVSEFFSSAFRKNPLCCEMLSLSELLCDSLEIADKKEHATVAYLRNPLTLSAVKCLTSDITTVHIKEVQDFRSACEEVCEERADYCILPVSSSGDGYYPSFTKLIKTYDLKICKMVRVQRSDSDEEVQFALISSETEIPKKPEVLVFSFTDKDETTLYRLISSFSAEGCKPQSITSSPLAYNMDRFEHRIEIDLCGCDPSSLIFFLEAALPGHTVLGIY